MKRSLLTLAVAAVLLTGCSSGGDPATTSAPADRAGGSTGAEPGGEPGGGDATGGGRARGAPGAAEAPGGASAPEALGTQRAQGAASGTAEDRTGMGAAVPLGRITPTTTSVVRTGELEVVVQDVDAAADEVARLVRAARGQVEADDRSRDDGPERASLRLRIPPGAFDTTVGRLGGLGEERYRRLGSQDVTEQVVDLDSRVASQRASVTRVRALLADAKTLGEVVQVEAELTRRTADLESLEARSAALSAQVDLGTLDLRLTAADPPGALAGGPAGFSDGLREGLDALRAVGRAAGVAVGALLPWSPVLLLAGLLLWRARRRTA